MKPVDLEEKITHIKDENERKVVEFLRKLGFECIDCNIEIGEHKHQLFGEIDSMFKFGDNLFLVEVSKKTDANEKRITFFTKWTDKDILKLIIDGYKIRPKKIIRVYFEMQGEKPEDFPSPYLKVLTGKGKWNKVVYSERFVYFENRLQNDISNTRDEFLKELELLEQDSFKTILKKIFRV